jgi:hypothetical protein
LFWAVSDDTFKMFLPFDTTMISLDSSAEDHVLVFFFPVFDPVIFFWK